jgi:hypothetical protein
LGVDHVYRYINATNVYTKGKADGFSFSAANLKSGYYVTYRTTTSYKLVACMGEKSVTCSGATSLIAKSTGDGGWSGAMYIWKNVPSGSTITGTGWTVMIGLN